MASKSFEGLVQQIKDMSVLELSNFVKELETTFGVSAAMPMMAAPAAADAGQAAKAEEKSAYKVTLEDGGSEKIKVIKALRAVVPTLGLAEAKAAVEGTPYVVAESASKEDAEKMKKELEAAGAKVKLS